MSKRPLCWAAKARWWEMAASSSMRAREMLKSLETFSEVQPMLRSEEISSGVEV